MTADGFVRVTMHMDNGKIQFDRENDDILKGWKRENVGGDGNDDVDNDEDDDQQRRGAMCSGTSDPNLSPTKGSETRPGNEFFQFL